MPIQQVTKAIIRSKSCNTNYRSISDTFAIIHSRIKANKNGRPQTQKYPSRYTYTGCISGSNYILTNEFSASKCVIEKTDDQPYKNHALLIGYSGTKYIGNQRQPGHHTTNTIEEEVLKAMLKCNWITDNAYRTPWQVKMQNASRTDRGVSAARQCYSIFMSKIVIYIYLAVYHLAHHHSFLHRSKGPVGHRQFERKSARRYSFVRNKTSVPKF